MVETRTDHMLSDAILRRAQTPSEVDDVIFRKLGIKRREMKKKKRGEIVVVVACKRARGIGINRARKQVFFLCWYRPNTYNLSRTAYLSA